MRPALDNPANPSQQPQEREAASCFPPHVTEWEAPRLRRHRDPWNAQRQHLAHWSALSSTGSRTRWEIGGILWRFQEQGREEGGGRKPIGAAEKVLQVKLKLRAGKQLARDTAESGGTGSDSCPLAMPLRHFSSLKLPLFSCGGGVSMATQRAQDSQVPGECWGRWA